MIRIYTPPRGDTAHLSRNGRHTLCGRPILYGRGISNGWTRHEAGQDGLTFCARCEAAARREPTP